MPRTSNPTAQFIVALTLFVAIAVGAPLSVHAAEVEPGLRDSILAQGEASYLVYMAEEADLDPIDANLSWEDKGAFVYDALRATAKESQADLLLFLKERVNGGDVVDYQSFFIANVIHVTSGVETLDAIAQRPDVGRIQASVTIQIPEPDPAESPQAPEAVEWGVERIRAPEVWSTLGTTGEGIVVANIDTGALTTHAALSAQYRGTATGSNDFNFYDPAGVCGGSPCDNHGHGSHTMGTMVGDDGGSNQIGVAPGAQWIAAKGCESSSCSDASLLSSAEWLLAPCPVGVAPGAPGCDPNKRPHIINNSWGGGSGNPWYQASVDAWDAAGIFHVFSAGNSGPGSGTIGSPSDYCNTISVGNTNSSDVVATTSSRGPGAFPDCTMKPDVSAPGSSIRSSWNDGGYATIGGTSMAAPHVAGCLALMLSLDPGLLYSEAIQILKDTAVDLGSPGHDNDYGWGRIDCYEATQLLQPDFLLTSSTPTVEVCRPDDAVFTVDVGGIAGFSDPVTLASTPFGVFGINPITPPGSTTLTLATGGLPPGAQTVNLAGTSTTGTKNLDLDLVVYDTAPSSSTLLEPIQGATNVSTLPTFSWLGDGNSHLLEVATDPGFTNVILSEVVAGSDPADQTFAAVTPLSLGSLHFWRVTSSNPCGTGGPSMTGFFYTGFETCSTPELGIPDNDPAGVTDTLAIPVGGTISDLDLSLTASHTWVGDLAVTLTHTDTGTAAVAIDRPGVPASTFGCAENDIDVVLDDEAVDPVETACASSPPALGGSLQPEAAFSIFDGESTVGTWELLVSDNAGGDTGTVHEWCLLFEASGVGDLALSVTESVDPVIAGSGPGNLVYTLTVTNVGAGEVTQVLSTFDLTLPPGTSFDDATASSGIVAGSNWVVPTLASAAQATLTLTITVGLDASPGVDVISVAGEILGAAEGLINPGDDAASESTSIQQNTADLSVTLTDDVLMALPGDVVTYLLEVQNTGPTTVVDPLVEDLFPIQLEGCSWTCVPGGGAVCGAGGGVGNIVDQPILPAGGSALYEAVCTVDPGAAPYDELINVATISAPPDVVDPDLTNNQAAVSSCGPLVLFCDGFETGDPSAWTVVP